ncbi:hypothetical protein ACFVAJ_19080 [Agromyces sp. NPDC057679]|uniref:hypothetical protein n=1 Tax=Agromyces sp. NPDC057679 TaxID=3346207 RepID=UPI00366F93FD
MPDFPYFMANLTSILRGEPTELKEWFKTSFPNTKQLEKRLVAGSGPLLVDAATTRTGTVGTAFDVMVRLLVDDGHHPIQVHVTQFWTEKHEAATEELTAAAQDARRAGDDGRFYRAVWAIALLTEVTRSMHVWASSQLSADIYNDEFSVDAAIGLAPADAVEQLAELRRLAEERLFPVLGGEMHLSPKFCSWGYLKAEADIVADGTLVDMKTTLGVQRKAGRVDTISPGSLLQVIGYTLLDFEDEYKIRNAGIYSSRYGNLAVLPVEELLELAAGKPMTVQRARDQVASIIGYEPRI